MKKKMKTSIAMALATIGLVSTVNISAAPIIWTVDASLSGSGINLETLTGSFTYDTDTLALTDVNLTIADFSGLDVFNYGFARQRAGFSIVDFFENDPLTTDLSGQSWVAIGFNLSGSLNYDNALGSYPVTNFITDPDYVVQSSRQECVAANCTTSTGVITVANAGTLTGVVPIPGALWLFGSGLMGLLLVNRKSRK